MDYKGVIIEESLEDTSVLNEMRILKTEIEEVTERMNTPRLKQWTLHTVEVPEEKAGETAVKISKALKAKEPWYADYKDGSYHYIIFRDRIFKVNRKIASEYEEAKKYGISLGIPAHQVNFTEDVVN